MPAELLHSPAASLSGTPAEFLRPWPAIEDRHQALVVEPRSVFGLQASLEDLAAGAPFCLAVGGTVGAVVAMLGDVPCPIRADIADLADRFAALLRVNAVRLRFEIITGNACRRLHSDYTDVRLITTYHGPGTQIAMGTPDDTDPPLWTMPAGHVGLFKGKRFGEGHAACRHCSPPAGDMGVRRIVLVIDTPPPPLQRTLA